jgi:hypothetical protein
MKWLLILLLSACTESTPHDPADTILTEIGKKVFPHLLHTHNLHPCECGWSLEAANNIRLLHCGFDHYNPTDIPKARELLLATTTAFLHAINTNPHIPPHLAIHPFPLTSIHIEIFLYNSDGTLPPSETLHVITLNDGTLKYKARLHDHPKTLTTIYIETSLEAYEKLHQKQFML